MSPNITFPKTRALSNSQDVYPRCLLQLYCFEWYLFDQFLCCNKFIPRINIANCDVSSYLHFHPAPQNNLENCLLSLAMSLERPLPILFFIVSHYSCRENNFFKNTFLFWINSLATLIHSLINSLSIKGFIVFAIK